MNVLADFAAHDARADFATRARALMRARGISSQRLGARVGLSRRQIDRLLAGTSGPALRHMAAIARELGAELRIELVSGRAEPSRMPVENRARISETRTAAAPASVPLGSETACVVCGKAIIKTRGWRRFCSDDCRMQFHGRLAARR